MVRLAFERAVFDVLFEPPFVTAHGQVPQGRILEYGRGAAQSGGGVDEVGGGQGAAAFLTLVAVRAVRLAFGAGPGDVPVREELVRFRVVELGFRFDFKAALLEQGEEKILGDPVVALTGRSGIVIERHVQSFERLLHFFVVPVDDFPGGDPVFLRPQRDGRTVFIAAAHPHHVRSGHALKARTDVTRQVGASDVSNVNLAIGIGQGRRHHQTFGVPV